jgi:hypothetical protein
MTYRPSQRSPGGPGSQGTARKVSCPSTPKPPPGVVAHWSALPTKKKIKVPEKMPGRARSNAFSHGPEFLDPDDDDDDDDDGNPMDQA